MSSSKQKRVHYEHGTKEGKSSHGHRSSRDSGVGSSSISDRASLGSARGDDPPYSRQQLEDQRHDLRAVQEALSAANKTIRQLEASKVKLDALLTESNKENRLLKREKVELMTRVDFLMDELEERKSKDRARREATSSRTSAAAVSSSARTDRRTTPPARDGTDIRQRRREDEASLASHGERRPPPSYNSDPNPFSPIPARRLSVSYATAPTMPTYAPAAVAYSAAPTFPTSSSSGHYPNDGLYHPYPL